jgi:hypothetical protein
MLIQGLEVSDESYTMMLYNKINEFTVQTCRSPAYYLTQQLNTVRKNNTEFLQLSANAPVNHHKM